MMANAARDPYWHAAVRREIMDHPGEAAAIEADAPLPHADGAYEPSVGQLGGVFTHLPIGAGATRPARAGRRRRVVHDVPPDRP